MTAQEFTAALDQLVRQMMLDYAATSEDVNPHDITDTDVSICANDIANGMVDAIAEYFS